MATAKHGIFISHYSLEKAIALKLQAYLRARLGPEIPVFVSSDRDSIGGGRVWFNRIRESLKDARVVIVLLSPSSRSQDWILFEAGVGDGANACVIPVVFNGLTFGSLEFPLKGFHGRTLDDLDGLVSDITREHGWSGVPPPSTVPDFKADSDALKAMQLESAVHIRACIDYGSDKWTLNMNLHNTGPAVHLIKVEVAIPEAALYDENWFPNRKGILETQGLHEDEMFYHLLIYLRPTTPATNPRGYPMPVLPNLLARHDTFFLTPLKTELKVLTHPLLHESFRWQVFSEEGDCLPHYVKFVDVARCPATPD